MKRKVLVFPCGSEVALEIHRSLRYSIHFDLMGASSVNDHGRFVFENYIGNIPYYTDPLFIPTLKKVIEKENIDGVFPATDAVAKTLKKHEAQLACVIIGSDYDTTALCSSKSATYRHLANSIPCPDWTIDLDKVVNFPVFIKPDEGYGSRNIHLAPNVLSADNFVNEHPNISFVFCEYLPGEEYTIDCFSNSTSELLFFGARKRARVSNGISVNTFETEKHNDAFLNGAHNINQRLKPKGAWFFQMKEDKNGEPVLLEVAARLGGASSYFRAKGVNFALLSAFEAFGVQVSIDTNDYSVELDRALSSRYRLALDYDVAYIDLDDCLILENSVNSELIRYIFESRNRGIKIILVTRHDGDVGKILDKYRLFGIFDEVIHVTDERPKSDFIDGNNSIFIDDSFAERAEVKRVHGIPVFSPDMVEMLN